MRDLGALGQDTFSSLCNSVGLIPNPSKIDKTGWDYFVEFPTSLSDNLPLDMQAAPIECKVQVKATDHKKRRVQISLSNLSRLVNAPMPAYVCLLQFEGQHQPKSIFLRHLGFDIISHILRRLRELSEKDITDLRKHSMTITFSEEDVLELSGASLKRRIEEDVPNGMAEYVKAKSEFIKSTGFESGHTLIQFNVAHENPIGTIIDHSLGLLEEIKVANVVARHKRFNIQSQKSIFELETATFRMDCPQSSKDCIVTLRTRKLGSRYSFKATMHLSPLYNIVPDTYNKIRVHSDLFELLIKHHGNDHQFSYSFTNKCDIGELRDFIDIMSLLSTNQKTELWIEILVNGLPPLEMSAQVNLSLADLEGPADLVGKAFDIVQRYRIADGVRLYYSDLANVFQSIIVFHKLVIEKNVESISFGTTDEIDLSTKVGVVVFTNTRLGEYRLGCMVGAVGIAIPTETGYVMQHPAIMFTRDIMVEEDQVIGNEPLLDLALEIAREMESQGITSIIINE